MLPRKQEQQIIIIAVNASNRVPFSAWAAELEWTGIFSYLLQAPFRSWWLAPTSWLSCCSGCISAPGLPASPSAWSAVDRSSALEHPAIDPPRERKKKWKKKSINTKQLNKTPNSTDLMLLGVGIGRRRHPPHISCKNLMFWGQEANMVGVI